MFVPYQIEKDEKLREVLTSEILDKIQKGEPVEYDCSAIKGNLVSKLEESNEHRDLSQDQREIEELSENTRTVYSSILITCSIINGILDCSNIIFKKKVTFADVTFNEDVKFTETQFCEGADFMFCTFNKRANFEAARFSGKADFASSQFNGLNFDCAQFEKEACFQNTKFNAIAEFMKSKFKGLACFEAAEFCNHANFVETRFEDKADFNMSKLCGTSNFGKSNFNGEIDLLLAKFDCLRLKWDSIKDHIGGDESTYEALINNYKDLGWFEDADECYYTYRICRRDRKLLDYLAQIFYGYGLKPIYPIIWSVFLILVFGLVFQSGHDLAKYNQKDILSLTKNPPDNYLNYYESNSYFLQENLSESDPYLFSWDTYTSGLTSFIYPNIKFKPLGMMANLALFERLLGSIFVALFLASIGKTLIR
jgi:hypothetical protein